MMKALLGDGRVRRLLVANTLGSIGSGITIFSVPWIMVHRAGGNDAFRWATLGTTVILFLFMPYYGAWIDRHSRKGILLLSEAFGLTATLSMAVTGLALGHFELWQLVVIYFCGMFYYTLHYPAKFAFLQQIFAPSQYRSLMGLIEVQGQAAMMIAGGLGGILVEHVPLWVILLFDASTYLASLLIQSTIPYECTHLSPDRNTPPLGTWQAVAEGWTWLRQRPSLTVFLTASMLPFVVVMASNYLFPIYVAQSLHAPAWCFAGGEIAFALGAMVAGALLPRLLISGNAARTIPFTLLLSLIAISAMALFRLPSVYLLMGTLIGFGNAGCRVARSALMLHVVPNALMGRVGIFYSALDRLLRTVMVGAMGIIDWYGPPAGFLILAAVMLLAFVSALRSRGSAEAAQPITP